MNHHHWQRVGAVVALLALGLLIYVNWDRDKTGLYRGHYTAGFEAQFFLSCGDGEPWWVTVRPEDMPAITAAQTATLTAPADGPVTIYVEWHGTRSARRGMPPPKDNLGYGHLGMYPRLFTVDQLIAARPPRPDDCE